MKKCNKCGQYYFGETHGCKKFKIIDEDGEIHEQYGFNERDAALKYAEKSNEKCDYYLMNDSVEINVNGKVFIISAEPDIHYSASEVDSK